MFSSVSGVTLAISISSPSVGRHLQPAKFYGVGPSAGSAPLGGALLGRPVRLRGLLVLGAIVLFVTAVPG